MFNLEKQKILFNKIVIGLKDGFDALLEWNMVFVHINHHFYCTLAVFYPSGQRPFVIACGLKIGDVWNDYFFYLSIYIALQEQWSVLSLSLFRTCPRITTDNVNFEYHWRYILEVDEKLFLLYLAKLKKLAISVTLWLMSRYTNTP